MIKNLDPLEPDKCFHLYNRANGNENLFVNNGNYIFFLKRYAHFINPIAETFAYCLMPNHFHFALRIKRVEELKELDLFNNLPTDQFLSKQFSNLFSSYTQAFNKQQNRKGSLFIPRFRRKTINSKEYFLNVIHYIHYNPVHHQFVDDLSDWKHSSFNSLLSEKATCLKREQILDWFENKEAFYLFHKNQIDEKLELELEVF